MRYEATVRYVDRDGRPYEDRYVADLTPVMGLQSIRRKDEHEAAKALEEVSGTLKSWTLSNRGVRVFTKSADRYGWENGHLIRHPRPAVRWLFAVVEWATGVTPRPPYSRMQGGWRYWVDRLGERWRADREDAK